MAEGLALKYRPKAFSDVVGQKITAVVLDRMVAEDSVPQGLLFTGPRGSGKTSVARILAGALGTDTIEVDAASHGLVDDVRQMVESLRYAGTRVVIYDEAHSMSREAFNALLKVLEEPPAGTVFILVTTEPDKIPETVKSRLMEFTFRKLTPAEIFPRLSQVVQAEGIAHSDSFLTYIALRSDGSMRDALNLLDQAWRAGISDKTQLLEMSGEADVGPDLVLALLSGNHAHVYEVADALSQRVPDPFRLASMLTQTLTDVLRLKSGGNVSSSDEALDKRKTIAHHLEAERVVAAMKLLWDLRTRVRASNDPRGNLDLVLTLIMDIFTQGRTIVPKPMVEKANIVPMSEKANIEPRVVAEPRRLTLAEL